MSKKTVGNFRKREKEVEEKYLPNPIMSNWRVVVIGLVDGKEVKRVVDVAAKDREAAKKLGRRRSQFKAVVEISASRSREKLKGEYSESER
jgi:hypothetical protein